MQRGKSRDRRYGQANAFQARVNRRVTAAVERTGNDGLGNDRVAHAVHGENVADAIDDGDGGLGIARLRLGHTLRDDLLDIRHGKRSTGAAATGAARARSRGILCRAAGASNDPRRDNAQAYDCAPVHRPATPLRSCLPGLWLRMVGMATDALQSDAIRRHARIAVALEALADARQQESAADGRAARFMAR